MGSIFRICSLLVLLSWIALGAFMVMIAKAPPDDSHDTSVKGQCVTLVTAYGYFGLSGLLPLAALLHIAAEVSVIASRIGKLSGGRPSQGD